MKANTPTQLQYINRDMKPDLSFVLAVRKAQAGKYATRLLKTAGRRSLWLYAKVSDDLNHDTRFMEQYNELYGVSETEEQVLAERKRNYQGQFVAQ